MGKNPASQAASSLALFPPSSSEQAEFSKGSVRPVGQMEVGQAAKWGPLQIWFWPCVSGARMGESQTLAGGAQGRITEVAGRLELGLPLRQAAK